MLSPTTSSLALGTLQQLLLASCPTPGANWAYFRLRGDYAAGRGVEGGGGWSTCAGEVIGGLGGNRRHGLAVLMLIPG